MTPSRARPRARRHPTRVTELAVWGVGTFGMATAVLLWTARSVPPPAPAVVDALLRPVATEYRDPGEAVLAAARVLAAEDPFRVTHRPAEVAVGAVENARAGPPPSGFMPPMLVAARPRLALLGIIGSGARWEAVLAGVAGRDGGALVRAGDTLGSYRVRRVTADSLVVQETLAGRDTVWHLTLGTAALGAAVGVGPRP